MPSNFIQTPQQLKRITETGTWIYAGVVKKIPNAHANHSIWQVKVVLGLAFAVISIQNGKAHLWAVHTPLDCIADIVKVVFHPLVYMLGSLVDAQW